MGPWTPFTLKTEQRQLVMFVECGVKRVVGIVEIGFQQDG